MKKKILLVNDTSLVCHHGCTLLMQCIYKLFKDNSIIIKDRIFYEENFTDYLNKKIDFDLILINGEGTIHGKNNANKIKIKQIFHFIKYIKKNYTIPIVIFNSTISALNSRQFKILNSVDKIYVRESHSYKYLKKNKIKSMVIPDLLSLLYFKNKKKGNKIIVNDSSISKKTIKLKQFSKLKKYSYVPILYNNYLRYLRYLIYQFSLKYKLNFLTYIYLEIKSRFTINFIKKTNNSKFIFTGRFHAIFIALALMKPFYTFESDTYKIRGLMTFIGIEHRIIDIKLLKAHSIVLKKFSKEEIHKINRFRIQSKKIINIFINQLKTI